MTEDAKKATSNKYAIFDMDGTLIDSIPLLDEISVDYLAKRSIPPDKEFNSRAKTMSLYEYSELLRNIAGNKETIEETLEEIKAHIERVYSADISAKPKAFEYIEKLRSNGVRMCVASATEEKFIVLILSRLGLLPYFEFIVTVSKAGKSKDDPAVFIDAAKRFGETDYSMITVYEDSPTAMKTAKSAGFWVRRRIRCCRKSKYRRNKGKLRPVHREL